MSFIFYDTETTGTDHDYDQILQVAAIQTDADLNEVDRVEIRCRLLPHVVPSPQAMLVTGVDASLLTETSLPSHYEMIRQLRTKFQQWSPALFMGWNSVEFDERLLRQAFYKTLHDPYQTVRDGNSRTDALRIAQACSIFAPYSLRFPVGKKGAKSFKLDQLAPLNGFSHENAHDAMADVEAVIHICRIMMNSAPEVWSNFMRYSTKAAVTDFINEEPVFCFTDFYFGKPSSSVVTVFGDQSQNAGNLYLFELHHDPAQVRSLTDSQLDAFVSASPKPVKRFKVNAAPMFTMIDDAHPDARGTSLQREVLVERASILQSDRSLQERLLRALERRHENSGPQSPHIERQLFAGFVNAADQERMERFHSVPWPDRLAIVSEFEDARLKAIGTQLIYTERPEVLHESVRVEHDRMVAGRLLGRTDFVEWLTFPQALKEIEQSLGSISPEDAAFLRNHELALRQRHTAASALLD